MKWLNEPPSWRMDGDELVIVTGDKTDFWQRTFYGFRHDNGHFRYQQASGDFTASATFTADYRALYDQAGLMIRFSSECWIKAGVEFVHGKCNVGCVLTRGGVSDWSIGPGVSASDPISLRLHRKGDDICVQWAPSGGTYDTLRLGHLSPEAEAMAGVMTCSPTRAGLVTRFSNFSTGPLIDFADEV